MLRRQLFPPFGALLRQARMAAGLTQAQLAERATLSVRGISDLERGINRTPRSYTIGRLAETLRSRPPSVPGFLAPRCARRQRFHAKQPPRTNSTLSAATEEPNPCSESFARRRLCLPHHRHHSATTSG